MPRTPRISFALIGAALVLALGTAFADEAAIRKNLAERLADLSKIDEVSKTPIAGLYEVRIGHDVFYSDESGNYLIQGNILDTRTRTDITQARINKLTAIDFASLPLKDAVVYTQGSGARKLVVFSDPNCPYCKRFEKDLLKVKDITVYTFLYPILGGDSPDKARDIWCAKDQAKVWRDWMIEGKTPPRSMGQCDLGALERNTALGRKHKVTGTPAMVFEDGTRVPGALPPEQVEKQLLASSKAKSGG
jgi:thiol:disulfide interchange protein DsbC